MSETIRTLRDVLADLHRLFEIQAPGFHSRDNWNRLTYELLDKIKELECPSSTPVSTDDPLASVPSVPQEPTQHT